MIVIGSIVSVLFHLLVHLSFSVQERGIVFSQGTSHEWKTLVVSDFSTGWKA